VNAGASTAPADAALTSRIAGVPHPRLLERLSREVVGCRKCPRLVEWRERVAREKRASFLEEDYWARPVPGFGDAAARILLVGLAPAAHGGNRTGRIFTGDRSGAFLFAALYRCGLSKKASSVARGDGLRLKDAYIAAVNRCCPPANRPTPEERDNCLPYLVREIQLLDRLRLVVPLGAYAWDGALRALAAMGHRAAGTRPVFRHGAEARVGPYVLLGSFHPSQQNTFTGRLTPRMLDAVLLRAKKLGAGPGR
jgi:uracil-DNA glycosylase family 4